MTLSSSVSRVDYIGNGAASVYAYTFKIFSASDLLVTVRDTDGIETTLANLTDYTVSNVGSPSGGDVTLTAGNLASGYALTIRRVRSVIQDTDLRNQGAFYPEVHEDALDKIVMVQQQQDDEVARTIKLPETEAGTPSNTTLPAAAERANKILGFDGSGNPMAFQDIPTGSLVITSFGESLVDDANATSARQTLGFTGSGGTVATTNIEDSAVTTAKINDLSVTTGKINDLAVTNGKINDSAVTTAKINDGSVTTQKLADGSVSGVKLATYDGWTPITDALTYASSTTFTVSGDKRSIFRFGSRIKLTQTTAKYFYVKNVSFSTNTTVTVTGGTDYSLANASITSPYISFIENPDGFPVYFNYTPTLSGWSSTTINSTYFTLMMSGYCYFRFHVSGTSNSVNVSMTFPIRKSGTESVNVPIAATDNSVALTTPGIAVMSGLSGQNFDLKKDYALANWTSSGTKIVIGQIMYSTEPG